MDELKKNIPPFHSKDELKEKIEYIKWLVLLSTVGLSASVGLYKYFMVTSDALTWFYEFGWVCLVGVIWVGFQAVYVMAATKVFRLGPRKKAELIKVVKRDLKKPGNENQLSIFTVIFKSVSIQFEVVVYLFMAGFASLGVGILYPFVAGNPIKSLTMIPAVLAVFWFACPAEVRTVSITRKSKSRSKGS